MTHYKGNNQEAAPQSPKVDQGRGHEHSGARESGEQTFADEAEKRAKDKHEPQRS